MASAAGPRCETTRRKRRSHRGPGSEECGSRNSQIVSHVVRRSVRDTVRITTGVCRSRLMSLTSRSSIRFALVVALGALVPVFAAGSGEAWIATWASAQQRVEPGNLPAAPGFRDATLRQLVRVSRGGSRLRVTFSNEYGSAPLVIGAASIAVPAAAGAIRENSVHPLRFDGKGGASVAPGSTLSSDELAFECASLADLAVSVHVVSAPEEITGHPGSRTTSYLLSGDQTTALELPGAQRIDRWYLLSRIETLAPAATPVLVVIGDSITDGRGSTTNGNDRWPDQLARRLHANRDTAEIAVVNQGIGGNRVLHDGLGPAASKRFERDVLAIRGVRWVIVLEGINDLGGMKAALERGEKPAVAPELIAAYMRMAELAHARGLKIFGATILPFEGAAYFSAAGEADRQAVNHWIRTSCVFDAVIDFDAVMRDPAQPTKLGREAGAPDGLHPDAGGYRRMAESVDLRLFRTGIE